MKHPRTQQAASVVRASTTYDEYDTAWWQYFAWLAQQNHRHRLSVSHDLAMHALIDADLADPKTMKHDAEFRRWVKALKHQPISEAPAPHNEPTEAAQPITFYSDETIAEPRREDPNRTQPIPVLA